MTEKKINNIVSGIQPSGNLHLGNYFGAIKPQIDLQEQPLSQRFYFVANFHALTSQPQAEALKTYSLEIAAAYLALGLDLEKSALFLQSDIPEVCELSWIFSTLMTTAQLERATTYKDKIAKGMNPNVALFSYPVLQTADIAIFKGSSVPVGRDQIQHIEIARTIIQRFNQNYGEIFPLPEAQIREETALVLGTDGQKMSKSYNNDIPLFSDSKSLKKKVMNIKTDSKGLAEKKDPAHCAIFALYELVATSEERAEMAENYRAGGYGYGHAKMELFHKLESYFRPFYEKYAELIKNPSRLREILHAQAQQVRPLAQETLREVRSNIGIL